MKNLHYAGVLLAALFVTGCKPDARVDVAGPKTPLAQGASPEAQSSAKQGMSNAEIERQIRLSHRLPNGQPLPGPGQPPPTSLNGG